MPHADAPVRTDTPASERVALVSSCVPLIAGGARFIVEWTEAQLRERGHRVESFFVPTTDEPEFLLDQMAAFRLMDFQRQFDRVITFRPPAHLVRHPRKVCWFIHHVRILYDLWDSPYRGLPDTARGRALRASIRAADTAALAEAHRLFANSQVVAERVLQFNGLSAEVLYPPLQSPGIFRSGPYGDAIVSVCRIERHKRQHLLVEALARTRTPVRLVLCGRASNPAYVAELRSLALAAGVGDRCMVEDRWIPEEEKVRLLAGALASAYVPLDEDSYGYPTLEAAQAGRCTLTCLDSGGTLEFVRDRREGLITLPTPDALAAAFDELYADRELARRLGEGAAARVVELGISWDRVVERLMS